MRWSNSSVAVSMRRLWLVASVSLPLLALGLNWAQAPPAPQAVPGQSLSGQSLPAQSLPAPQATPAPMTPPPPRPLVIIDPAHGGSESGAVLNPLILEKDVTLALARRLRQDLSAH